MKTYRYRKVDAFTFGASLGNPAAFLLTGEEQFSPEQMLQIGKEHAGFVSEFVFCSSSDKAEIKLTYYSSECEVDFCGHGTIATMYELIKSNEKWKNQSEISFETNKKGVLCAYNHISEEDAVYISAPKAEFLELTVTEQAAAEALGLEMADFHPEYPMEVINAGLRTLIVPISTYQREVSLYPDQKSLKQFCEKNEIDIVLTFCMETKEKENFAHTRVYAPRFGYLEDPATGSGNSAFGNYLLKNKMWDKQPIALEQGGDNRIFNIVRLRCRNDMILFGGSATTRIRGEYIIQNGR